MINDSIFLESKAMLRPTSLLFSGKLKILAKEMLIQL